jgi:hypothetical protein
MDQPPDLTPKACRQFLIFDEFVSVAPPSPTCDSNRDIGSFNELAIWAVVENRPRRHRKPRTRRERRRWRIR